MQLRGQEVAKKLWSLEAGEAFQKKDKCILAMFVLPLSEDLLMTSVGDNILEKALNPPRTAVLAVPSPPFFPLKSALGIATFAVCLYRWDHFCL